MLGDGVLAGVLGGDDAVAEVLGEGVAGRVGEVLGPYPEVSGPGGEPERRGELVHGPAPGSGGHDPGLAGRGVGSPGEVDGPVA